MIFGDSGEQHLLQNLTELESDKRLIRDEFTLTNLCKIVMYRLLSDAYPISLNNV